MVNSWKNSLGKQFSLLDIAEIIQKFPKAQIHVGTDSHFKTGHLIFATVIAIHEPGECSKYFFKRTKNLSKKIKTPLKIRLLKEVQDSIDIANSVREIIGEKRIISVHADISENKKNKSSIVSEQARNWIYAMGFDCRMKPISWASSSIADLHAK